MNQSPAGYRYYNVITCSDRVPQQPYPSIFALLNLITLIKIPTIPARVFNNQLPAPTFDSSRYGVATHLPQKHV